MARAIWRWVNWAVVGACLLASALAAVVTLWVVIERHRIADLNRTHERPLLVHPDDPVLANAHQLLGTLRPPPSRDSLQFVVMPSFGPRWFAVSLAQTGSEGVGEANVVSPDGRRIARYEFVMPTNNVARLLARWDALSDGYSGEGHLMADGNPLAFERHRGNRVTSGEGNSPCHYDVLGDLAAQSLSTFVPELLDLRIVQQSHVSQSDLCRRSILG